nr:MAG TPA: hypothetical protein [Caudoviricetes sp.]
MNLHIYQHLAVSQMNILQQTVLFRQFQTAIYLYLVAP